MSSQGYAIIRIDRNAPRNIRIRIYKLFNGTTVSVKGRRYKSKGLIETVNGAALSSDVYLVPLDKVDIVLNELRQRNLEQYTHILNLCSCPCPCK